MLFCWSENNVKININIWYELFMCIIYVHILEVFSCINACIIKGLLRHKNPVPSDGIRY
jgi:hypothetical protein